MTVGGGAQTDPARRWGDYSMTTIDPSDNRTFWHVNEYYPTTSSALWATKIGRFAFPTGAVPPVFQTRLQPRRQTGLCALQCEHAPNGGVVHEQHRFSLRRLLSRLFRLAGT